MSEEKPVGFRNLAGLSEVDSDDQCDKELVTARIQAVKLPITSKGEVKTHIMGGIGKWSFRRAWRYWVAEGPGIPPDIAEKLHATHGTQVRVDGHCGCPSPLEWFKGLGVGMYHVDTQEGLNALSSVLRGITDE